MYQALYRKYRPKTFDDVCGQGVITTTLKNEIAGGKASHAYLFTGLRGSGKTTCSKIIAKALNCLHPVDGNPCNDCEICRGIDADAITDVMEIDAASNSGVDYMRELREQAFFPPVRCKKRVYIIDETHMLSMEAFNALLKIMEEPPEHVVFILATTEVHKVPATIISRCQRFDFQRIEAGDIAGRLAYIAQQEGFTIEREAALTVARIAEGGMRDAISLLERCWSHAPHIDIGVVADCAGLSGNDALFALSEGVLRNDCAGALLKLDGLLQGTADPQRLCEQLISHFRNLMVARCADNLSSLIVCLPEELESYKGSAAPFEVGRLLEIIGCLQDTLSRMGRTQNKRLELETAFVRICTQAAQADTGAGAASQEVRALAQRLDKLEAALAGGLPRAGDAKAALPAAAPAPPPPPPVPVKEAVPFAQWAEVLARLQSKNKALFGALAGSSAYLAGDLILIDSRNELFIKLIRENEYARQNIHACIIEVTGRKHRIGPYKQDQYRVREAADPLDGALERARELDVPVRVQED